MMELIADILLDIYVLTFHKQLVMLFMEGTIQELNLVFYFKKKSTIV